MKRLQKVTLVAFTLALPALATANAADHGPAGGAGGGEFRTACNPGDSIVGFDVQATHVVTRIAAVCGKHLGNGTVGTPWVGSEVPGAAERKLRCKPGSILTLLHVFIDSTPLVSSLGFTCFDRMTGKTNDVLPFNNTATAVSNQHLECTNQHFGTGIFGRAGTAIDALGLHCDKIDPKEQ